MKERTTSSRMEMQPLLSDSPIKVITCKAGDKICRSLVITEAEFDIEANNYKGFNFLEKVVVVYLPFLFVIHFHQLVGQN
ncbi:hypothetical protein RDI58_014855 [Solanum bulbocastanum]|uniref:Uncharacterized protein n=1 Tax=Solanum bulbocastanum TaxID=147425 RepID=A0AAN8TFT1_SOLBU